MPQILPQVKVKAKPGQGQPAEGRDPHKGQQSLALRTGIPIRLESKALRTSMGAAANSLSLTKCRK